MDFEQLKTFLQVSRLRSFSRAAEKLGLTQPAISAQVRSLETEIGARLFERDSGKVTFTPAGRLFEAFAEHCLLCHSHIGIAVKELQRSPRGEISIVANEGISLYVLPEMLAKFRSQCTRVNFSIVRAERTRAIESVLNRESDFGVVSLPIRDARLRTHTIFEDEVVLVVPSDHPLATRTIVKPAELVQYPLVMLKHGRQRENLDHFFRTHDLNRRVAVEIDSSELLKQLIATGHGIGFLPRTNIAKEEARGALKGVAVEGMRLRRKLGLIFRKDKSLTRAAQNFLEIVVDAVPPDSLRNGTDPALQMVESDA